MEPHGVMESQNLIKKGKVQVNKSSTSQLKRKGIVRWHGAVSTNLLNQKVLVPNEELSSDSDSGSFMTPENKKKSLGQKMKVFLGKVLTTRIKEAKPAIPLHAASSRNKSPVLSHKQHHLPKMIQHLSLSRETAKRSGRRISQAEAETERITANKLIVRSKKTTRRVSVTSVPAGLQKGKKRQFALVKRKKKAVEKVKHQSEYTIGNLQMQVDDLIETMADKSSKLLAQRHEELRECESLGDEILQCSKQFQRVSKKNTRKYKFKNVCFPCSCCCY
ncbi:putative uncharacterized protein C3orf49 homolog isoform X2 [Hyla sarda]|uniref:putative uncharacterized protein C3orf49 homolog isoform X2 n=1 Tax=Hyla sarda TaxID=327740 RepID=UPI0024C3ABF8|nr:putative uncharacterized protein C3orf49 homolog isoform X2 [Hyla sarda]